MTSTTTTSTYLTVSQNLPRMQAMTAAEPAVKTASDYYAANIGKVTSAKDLVGNYRLLSYALESYGLGSYVNSKALVTQVLEGGVSNPKSLANTLPDANWAAFAKAYDFTGSSATSTAPSSASAISTTESKYVEQQLETDQGSQDPGVQLALYFNREASSVTNAYQILADPNLLHVVQTIFGLSQYSGSQNLDLQAKEIGNLIPMSDLQDPKKVAQLTERFTAMYDSTYGPNSGTGQTLAYSGGVSSTTASAASTILSGVISANGSAIATTLTSSLSTTPLFSSSLMSSLQSFKLGG